MGPSRGLIAYWPFTIGDKIYDLGPNGYNGYFFNQSTSTGKIVGKIGQGFSFGATGYASTSLNNVQSLYGTVVWWMRPHTPFNSGATRPIWGQLYVGGKDFTCQVFFNNNWYCGWANTGQDNRVVTAANNTNWKMGQWGFYAYTWDNVSSSLYANGVLIGQNFNPPPIQNWATPFVIGSLGINGGEYFDGDIDEFRIYNRQLSSAELSSLYTIGRSTFNNAPKTIVNNGLVGYWTMDGKDTTWTSASAGTTRDVSGNGNTLTLSNMLRNSSVIQGKTGQAFTYNGSNQMLSEAVGATNPELDITGDVTISAWINPNGNPLLDYKTIVRAGLGADTKYGILYDTSKKIDFLWYDGVWKTVSSSHTVPLNTWTHVITVRSGSTVTFYINGTNDGSAAVTAPTVSAVTLGIGRSGASNQDFSGGIDDVRIYNRALNASEARDIYNASAGKLTSEPAQITSGLVGYWTMNGTDVNWATGKVSDSSGNGNVGYVQNMATTTSVAQGKLGQALKFNGRSSFVDFGSGASLKPTSSVSISAWVKFNSLASQVRFLSDWHQTISTDRWLFLSQSNGTFCFYVSNLNETSAGCTPNFTPVLGAWYLVTGVYDGNNPRLYVNGNLIGQGPAIPGPMNGGAGQSVRIGNQAETGGYLDGMIDDFRIYNRVLSPNEIKQLYNMGR
jgi:hypothetical protein